MNYSLDQTLEQIDGVDWGEPTFPSRLVHECHRLRRVPLKEMTAGDLRLLIGQKIYPDILVPLAIELLQNDPWLEADYYEGDLLKAVLNLPNSFWIDYPDLKSSVDRVAQSALRVAEQQDGDEDVSIDDDVLKDLLDWK
ncbi:MAG: hypothetical protein KY468_13865 [Armatimonadetes bacterium]|nr:hypothetical protein [Armatimonadota bacterium]